MIVCNYHAEKLCKGKIKLKGKEKTEQTKDLPYTGM
jgi:hypothetical protein